MKLRNKITLVFSVIVLLVFFIVGGYTITTCQSLLMRQIESGRHAATQMASNQISKQMEDYFRMVKVAATDDILTNSTKGEELASRINELAQLYGFTSGNALNMKGISYADGKDFSDREYVKNALNGEITISDVTLSKITGKYGFSVAGPMFDSNGKIRGVIYFRMDNDYMITILDRIKASDTGYAFIVDADGTVIAHADETLVNNFNVVAEIDGFGNAMADMASGNIGDLAYKYAGEALTCSYAQIDNTNGWGIIVVTPVVDYGRKLQSMVYGILLIEVILYVVTVFLAFFVANTITKIVGRVSVAMNGLTEGDFSTRLEHNNRKDELSSLENGAATLQDTFISIIGEEDRILGSISNYDLTESDMSDYSGEYDKITDAVNTIKHMLYDLISSVQEAASQVGIGTGEIASATENLSNGTMAQASSIDQAAQAINDIADRISNNSENEKKAQDKLRSLTALINEANEEMTELVNSVEEVAKMSNDINKIVGTIDSISFQTNILALNASVEAARAGENGKGFAVVADEVGNLATKSGIASKQTADLIEDCLKGIKAISENAKVTFECLNKVVSDAGEISVAFDEIAKDTEEQATKSRDIRTEINKISDVVQNNMATAEETAAATEEVSAQAENLANMIKRFRIK